MNTYIKVIALLGLVNVGAAFAYDYAFTNLTDQNLVIKVELMATNDNFFNVVGPGDTTVFNWSPPNIRAGFCLSDILIGNYDEGKVVNFPGTNSSTLPKIGNQLDKNTITKAIDARGPWFNSLAKINMKSYLPPVMLSDNDWKALKDKVAMASTQLKSGIAIQQVMSNIDMNTIKTQQAGKISNKCASFDFIVIGDQLITRKK